MSMTMSESVIDACGGHTFFTLEVYARSIYSCGMEPEVAKYHLGALALAIADSIASVSASFFTKRPGDRRDGVTQHGARTADQRFGYLDRAFSCRDGAIDR